MVTFVQELVNSLSIASVIILMGIGVTLIFGLTGIINFAHGEFLMLGAIGVWVLVGYGFGYIPALLIAVAIVGLIGFLLERGLFQFTLLRPNNGFMASLGLSIVIQHVVIRIWNSFSKSIPEPLPGVWQIGEITFIKMRVVVVAVTALVVAVTFFTISRSRYGLALRASLADRETAALMGIPIRRYITVIFTYGSAIAGLGGDRAAIGEDHRDIAADRNAHERRGLPIGEARAKRETVAAARDREEGDRDDQGGHRHNHDPHLDECDLADLPDPRKGLGDAFRERVPDADHDVLDNDGKAERGHEAIVRTKQRELEQTPLEEKADEADDSDGDEKRRNIAKAVSHQDPDADRAQH